MTRQRNYALQGYHPDDALTDGQWIIRRGVWHWEADEPPPADLHAVPDLVDDEPTACPTCGATVTQTCRTRAGHRTKDHPTREIPRACPCGAQVGWKKRLCEGCSVERRRQRRREQKARQRARLKVAS